MSELELCGIEYQGTWIEFRGVKCELPRDGHILHFQGKREGPLHWRNEKLMLPKRGRK